MDKSEVQRIVEESLRPMRHALWLTDWHLTVKYAGLADCFGECYINVANKQATITLDPDAHDGEASVLETLRHELLHCVLGYWDHVRRQVRGALSDGPMFDVVDEAMRLAAEHSVEMLGRVFDLCGMTTAALVERGQKLIEAQGA